MKHSRDMTTIQENEAPSIAGIVVRKLFGHYSYDLPDEDTANVSRVFMLYGDNGMGKTTILQMLLWLLSSKDLSGYKTLVSKVKFESFRIILSNGVEVGADRKKGELAGGYRYYVKQGKKLLYSIEFKLNSNGTITIVQGSNEDIMYKHVLAFIRSLNINVHFLSDERKLRDSENSTVLEEGKRTVIVNESSLTVDGRTVNRRKHIQNIDYSFAQLQEWIRTRAIEGAKSGDKDSQTIFSNLIRDISKQQSNAIEITKADLLKEIDNLSTRSKQFVELGFVETLSTKDMIASVKVAKNKDHLGYILPIIRPFIESVNAKLEALEEVRETVDYFVASVNDFFVDKYLVFNLNDGFTLLSTFGEKMDYSILSSGEKQLLMLFTNTITSSGTASVFIIDEPEISLNIKWQRRLLPTLLKFSSRRSVQFILATHSMEILSSNSKYVSTLKARRDVS